MMSTATPDKGTMCGLTEAELVTVSAPDLRPPLVGVKVTEILHVDPGLTVAQECVAEKSPVVEISVIVNGPVPVLSNVTVLIPLVVLTGWFPNEMLKGVTVAV